MTCFEIANLFDTFKTFWWLPNLSVCQNHLSGSHPQVFHSVDLGGAWEFSVCKFPGCWRCSYRDTSGEPHIRIQTLLWCKLYLAVVTPWTAAHQPSLSVTYLPEFPQTQVRWVSDAIQPSHPLSPLLLLPSVFPSVRVFSNESALRIRWPKYWSFSISPSNEYSGLISFSVDWFDLLAVQGTLKILLQHHSSKASVLQHSAFFMIQLSHSYMTGGKTIALTMWTFVSKMISLLFKTLSRFNTAILPRSKHLLISWLQSLSTFILEPKKMKSDTVCAFFPSICHKVIGPYAMILVFLMLRFKPAFLLCFFTFIRG